MAEQNKDQEKTEEPTSRKLEKAKEEGNVSKSQEINSVALLTISVIVLYMMGGWFYDEATIMFEEFYNLLDQPVENVETVLVYWNKTLWYMVIFTAPLMIILIVAGIVINLIQTGVVFTTKVFVPKPDKLDPIKGFGRIFSSKGFMELAKGISKIFVVGVVIYMTVKNDIELFMSLPVKPLGFIMAEAGRWIILIVTRILSALLLLSIVDAIYQRHKYRKDLRMSKQEVKDEYKQLEGDPLVKSARKRKALQLTRARRIDHAVLNSDVVVTNPTHYAVALRYKPEENDAPIIMAKGMRKRALKIREYAELYEIPIIENPPLARALFAAANEGEFVPPELYQAVAEILAYIYKINQQKAA